MTPEERQKEFLIKIDEVAKYFNVKLMKETQSPDSFHNFMRRLEIKHKLLDGMSLTYRSVEQAQEHLALIPELKCVARVGIDVVTIQCIDWDARLEWARKRIHGNIKGYFLKEAFLKEHFTRFERDLINQMPVFERGIQVRNPYTLDSIFNLSNIAY